MEFPARIADDRSATLCRALREYEGPLLRYAARLLGDRDRGRDVVQEAFLRLCREADPAALDGRLRPWLFRVVRQRAIDCLRKDGRMSSLLDSTFGEAASVEHDPAVAADAREAATSAVEAVQDLPDREQELIRLKFEHGMSYREMAETTGLSESNVGYLLHMAIKKLRAALGEPASEV